MEQHAQSVASATDVPTVLRIRSFGPLTLEWHERSTGNTMPLSEERLHGKGATPALSLLKLLICQPHRSASRDWILEQFWPEAESSKAEGRIDDVASHVRTLLSSPSGKKEPFLHYMRNSKNSGGHYRLAPYPLIWVDADAFEWSVQQAARLDRFGHDSLSLWEQAYQLATRGMFLPEEQYSDWAIARRERVEGQYRQCVHRLVHLLRKRGADEEALLRLRDYWQQHKTDEDALRMVLEMLGERGRYQEAERYYEQAREVLERDGRELNAKTRDVLEVMLVVQMQRNRQNISFPAVEENRQELGPRLSAQGIIPLANEQQSDISLFPQSLKYSLIETVRELGDTPNDPLKRVTLQKLATFLGMLISIDFHDSPHVLAGTDVVPESWAQLTAACKKPSEFNQKTCDQFEHLLSKGWELSNINELGVAEGVLSSFLPRILAIPKPEVNTHVAYLASQGLRLRSVIIHHRLQIADKVLMCEMSVDYARYANDANTLVPALIELADAYEFNGQIEKCLQTLQEALHYSSQASPLVQSRAYSNTAIILVQVGRMREAELYIQLAHDVFPADPLLDRGWRLADSSVFTLSYHTGLVRLDTGQVSHASADFDFYKEHPSGVHIPERLRLEIVNGHSKAAIRLNDLERYADFFENAITGSAVLGSQKRYEEAISIFQREMPKVWLADGKIRSLVEKYQLDRKR